MKQIKEIRVDSPIIPNKGIGELKLGMNSFYLRDFYNNSDSLDKEQWTSELSTPFFGSLNLNYLDYLTITINIFNGAIAHLKVKNGYKGKIDRIVGIGDSIRKYYDLNIDSFSEFEDGYFFYWIDREFGLSFFIGDNLEDFPNNETFEKYLDMPILEIAIFDDKQRIAVGAADLPKKWKQNNS